MTRKIAARAGALPRAGRSAEHPVASAAALPEEQRPVAADGTLPSDPACCARDGDGAAVEPQDLTPLEVMLRVMHCHWRARRYEKAAALARDAAPYLHPRLTRVAHQGGIALRHEDALEELD
jgi:hypothetical protein